MKLFCRNVIKMACFSFLLGLAGSCDKVTVERQTNDFATENMSFVESMRYWLDKDEFKSCKINGLEPLDTVWALTNAAQAKYIDLAPIDMKGDDLALYAVELAQNLDIQLSAKDRDHVVMHLFKKAADDGSTIAISEIGASLLFCYQHIEQDLPRAQQWLERAVEHDDPFAMHSLARMHLAGLTGQEDNKTAGVALIDQCAALGHEPCKDDLDEIQRKR